MRYNYLTSGVVVCYNGVGKEIKKMASKITVVRSLRASREFFDKCDLVAKAEGVDRNKLIVRVVSEYCEKVESTMIKQMEKCLNGEMLMSGIVRPIRAKENENENT